MKAQKTNDAAVLKDKALIAANLKKMDTVKKRLEYRYTVAKWVEVLYEEYKYVSPKAEAINADKKIGALLDDMKSAARDALKKRLFLQEESEEKHFNKVDELITQIRILITER